MNNMYSWNDMLEDFRTLGGVAENIEQRIGEYGLGLFPINPEKPIAIEVPDKLLIPADQLILDGDDLVINPAAGIPSEICRFIERYQKAFSWGAEGRESVEAFESSLRSLPEPLLQRLKEVGLLDLATRQDGLWAEHIHKSFLRTRRISYKNRNVCMPILELTNHSPNGKNIIINDGIQLRGTFADEVTWVYSSLADPLAVFFNYGFTCEEFVACSLPVDLDLNNGKVLRIGRRYLEFDSADKQELPIASVEGSMLILSHLRLGIKATPRIPRTLLRKRLPDLKPVVVDEIFERIRSYNLSTLCGLLELTDGDYTPAVSQLRKAVTYQLKALSYCFGVREDLL